LPARRSIGQGQTHEEPLFILKSGKKSVLAFYNSANGMVEQVEKRNLWH
jgi:PhoH-like ATPase